MIAVRVEAQQVSVPEQDDFAKGLAIPVTSSSVLVELRVARQLEQGVEPVVWAAIPILMELG